MKKVREKRSSGKRFSLAELLPSGETVVIYGEHRMTVQGCRRILSYSPTEITLRLKRRSLSIRGEGLICTAFSGGGTSLQGVIRSIEYRGLEENDV